MNELRLNLEDIVNSNILHDVSDMLNKIHENMPLRKVVFWYNGNISDKNIENSCNFLTNKLHMKSYYTKRSPCIDFVWFDIISDKKINSKMKNRFFVIYPSNEKNQILFSFNKYIEVVKFIDNSKKVMYKKNE